MVANKGNRSTMDAICTFFINDIKQYADKIEDNEELMPDYSVVFASGQESNVNISYRKFFIPVRLMLAELYLWRGSFTQSVADYREAIRYYHEFLTHGVTPRNYVIPNYNVMWNTRGTEKFSGTSSSYNNSFRLGSSSMVALVPMDTTTYYGNTSNIREVFSSKYSNNYYPAAVPSERVKEIFQSQNYLYIDYDMATSLSDLVPEYAPKDEATLRPRFDKRWWMRVGDLRFGSIYSLQDFNNSEHSDWSSEWMFNSKWEFNGSGSANITTTDQRPEFMPLYRLPIVYLHLAEALNRAGFPESAFVILKYGLSTSALKTYAASEFAELKTIAAISSKDVNFTEWDVNNFITADMVSFSDIANHRFNQWPIHALGCGDVYFDDGYNTGVDLSDPKNAVGDETIVAVLDDNGSVIYETDENGLLVLDEQGNPIPVTDPSQGTPVYNYGYWESTEVLGGVKGREYYAWDGFDVTNLDPIFQNLMSYEDFLEYLPTATQYYVVEDLDNTPEEELVNLYDQYKTDYEAFQATVKHNKALKAAVATDQQAGVAELILTEEALEGMFEGHRFGDLMRYSWQEGNPALLGKIVSQRPGEASPDGTLAGKLASEAGWYIKLPAR
jgi:hypothetical protein